MRLLRRLFAGLWKECLDYIDRLERKGQIYVIRPRRRSQVRRIERDQEKMRVLYEEGYADAERHHEELMRYLEK